MKEDVTCFDCSYSKVKNAFIGDHFEPLAECRNKSVPQSLLEENDYDEYKMPMICNNFKKRGIIGKIIRLSIW